MVASGQLGAVENAALEQSPWTTPHRQRTRWHERERHTRTTQPRVQEPWHEPASVEAIAGDELDRGCIEWSSCAYG
jgi:hypothetical protein